MVKLFRRKRQELLSPDKTPKSNSQQWKYFRYALGETLLVVIGILIALQINNWNDDRKTTLLTKNYYEKILLDFKEETANIDSLLIFLDKSIFTYDRYKASFQDSTASSRDIIFALFGVQYVYPNVKFNTNTIKTLENTGEIKHISPVIRKRIINLQRNFENILEMTQTNNGQYLDALVRAGELGLNDLGRRLKFQKDMREDIEAEYNLAKMIITADGGYRLKNFTERELKVALLSRLEDISEIEELISQEL